MTFTDRGPSAAPPPACRLATALLIGLAAAALFVLLSSIRLAAQGPQYDELHQAAGAFMHLGSPPQMFALVTVGGYPVMNMPYSAAIKTNLYGLYLRLSGARFSLASWRMLGILFLAAGTVLFCGLARWALPAAGLAAFLALLLTDGTVLVLGRYDWGPVALALGLRLAMVGLWLRGQAAEVPSPGNSFGLGGIAGLAIVEKLSSCLLLPALAAMILASRRRRNGRHVLCAAAGVAAGILPLVLVNLYTLHQRGSAISLSDVGRPVERSLAGFIDYSSHYFALGVGGTAAGMTLDLVPSPEVEPTERALAITALLLSFAVAVHGRTSGPARWAGASLLAYLAIWICLYLFPRSTWIHHWIVGTPFQYAAVTLALLAAWGDRGTRSRRALGVALAFVTVLWLGARLPALATLEKAFAEGRASWAWDPSLSRIGMFAAERAGRAIFVASDWGVGTQIHCFSNGRPRLLHELFWGYSGPEHLRWAQEKSGTRILYLVRLEPPAKLIPEATERIERDLASDPRWREAPVEPAVAHLRAVKVRKFLYLGSSGRAGPAPGGS